MIKVMDYNELKNLANLRQIRMKDIAKAVSIGENAFKQSFESGSMAYSKVPIICNLLGITAAQFFGEDDVEPMNRKVQYTTGNRNAAIASEGSVINCQTDSKVIEILSRQLAEKDEQIKGLIKALGK